MERVSVGEPGRQATDRPSARPAAAVVSRQPTPAAALALQRAVGNRSTARLLSRWAAHPDKDQKGQFMSDRMASSWERFNPPLSK